jgi:hypothetical protein
MNIAAARIPVDAEVVTAEARSRSSPIDFRSYAIEPLPRAVAASRLRKLASRAVGRTS